MSASLGRAGAAEFECVLSDESGIRELTAQREAFLLSALGAGLDVGIAVCVGRKNPAFENVRMVQAPADSSCAAALVLAAKDSPSNRLFFVPPGHRPTPAVLRAMAEASQDREWVVAGRGPLPKAAHFFQMAYSLPSVDLGAPAVIKRSALLGATASLGPGDPFLAVRTAGALFKAGFSPFVVPPTEGTVTPVKSWNALGLAPSRMGQAVTRRTWGLAIGAILLVGGARLSDPVVAGLLLFGSGFLVLGYFFGKAEC